MRIKGLEGLIGIRCGRPGTPAPAPFRRPPPWEPPLPTPRRDPERASGRSAGRRRARGRTPQRSNSTQNSTTADFRAEAPLGYGRYRYTNGSNDRGYGGRPTTSGPGGRPSGGPHGRPTGNGPYGRGRGPDRGKGAPRRRNPFKTALATTAVVGASGLAVVTGIALDRLVLPQLRSESAAATGPAPRAETPQTAAQSSAPITPGPDTGRQPRTTGGDQPPPRTGGRTPPLKPLHGPGAPPEDPSDSPTPGATDQPGDGSDTTPGSTAPETLVADLTNQERAKAGCKPLKIDQRLVKAARAHSVDMALHDYFDHTSLNGDSPWKRMEDAGYPSPGAENIAKGYATAADVVDGWMKSPGHRANILNCELRAIGVGMRSGAGGPWWTQDFGWK
ncbi:hypothetical protein J4573_34550 [Actinomadura barringtoniae]|uniref:SCP domain-containing protein n=1 Tax=Actinomadura barringtoniae TaxID=1427535 RepID=A0A939PNA2_9ACTN|nr:CAP domain-containing protein [Actinomadura barringtoniae]MBO2452254.1 hypothetical protein [Actinomadura barringtoniae]